MTQGVIRTKALVQSSIKSCIDVRSDLRVIKVLKRPDSRQRYSGSTVAPCSLKKIATAVLCVTPLVDAQVAPVLSSWRKELLFVPEGLDCSVSEALFSTPCRQLQQSEGYARHTVS